VLALSDKQCEGLLTRNIY